MREELAQRRRDMTNYKDEIIAVYHFLIKKFL